MMSRRVLILGTTGMLGHTLMRELSGTAGIEVYGAARKAPPTDAFPADVAARVFDDLDVLNLDRVGLLLQEIRPDVVVNCVGVIKQRPEVEDAVCTITVNSLFPHLLARECAGRDIRLIQISTDCVFSGDRGGYVETDIPDPPDLYGRSKLLGEVTSAPALTLRTSIIGHELHSNRSLVDWFLAQSGVVNGYTKALYSGITTVEFAALLRSVVLPREDLAGLYHVAATPISKYELLQLIARTYGWTGQIVPYDGVVCDRSLSAEAILSLTGYRPPAWPEMIARMHAASRRVAPRDRSYRLALGQ
jgi:dTDP-4-dehydrorhamnose reductase